MSSTSRDSSSYTEFISARVLAGYKYEYNNTRTGGAYTYVLNNTSSNDPVIAARIGTMDIVIDGVATTTGLATYLNSISGVLPAPTVTVSAGISSIRIDFQAPYTGFTVEITGDAGVETVSVPADTAFVTITGLTNGYTYSIRVAADNGVSVSEYTAAVTATPLAKPEKATDLAVVNGNGFATLSWTLADRSNLVSMRLYRNGVLFGSAIPIADTVGNEYTVEGLTNGLQYVFSISFVNVNGTESDRSDEVSAEPIGPPPPVSSVSIESGDGFVTVSWVRASPETDVASYSVDIRVGDVVVQTYTVLKTATNMSVTRNVANGSLAQGIVRSVNSGGSSAGVASSVITVRPPPSIPTAIIAADSEDGAVTVRWNSFDAAANNIDRLYVEARRSGAVVRTVEVTGLGSSPTSARIDGLTNGLEYEFRLKATNNSSSAVVYSVGFLQTPYPVPPVATAVSATAGIGQAVVTWTPPDVTTFVFSYTVETYTVDGGSVETLLKTNTGLTASSRPYPVTGLSNNVLHRFRVVSVNPRTTATAVTVGSATPRGTPATVSGLAGVEGSGFVDVTWNAVSGLDVDDYQVSFVLTSGGTEQFVVTTGTSVTLSGLSNNNQYTIKVRARNNVTVGAWSAVIYKTPLADPITPTGVSAADGTEYIDIAWNASATPSAQLTGYKVYVLDGGVAVAGSPFTVLGAAVTSYRAVGLAPNKTYSAYVTAYNGRNVLTESAPSATVSATAYAVPAGVPSVTGVTPGNARITIDWSISAGEIDAGATGFQVEVDADDTQATRILDVPGGVEARSFVVGNGTSGNPPLINNVTYTLRVRQRTPVTFGDWSTGFSAKPLNEPPAPSGPLGAVPSNGAVSVSWTAPTNVTYVAGYKIAVSVGGSVVDTIDVVGSGTANSSQSRNITGLTNGTLYSFTVRSYNAIFESAAIGPVTARPLGDPPVVAGIDVSGGDSFVGAIWDMGAADMTYVSAFEIGVGGSAATEPVAWIEISAALRVYRFTTGVSNGTAYKVFIRTKDVNGGRSVATISGAVTPKPVPPTLQGIVVTAGIGSVAVTWTEPAVTTYVNGYRLQMYKGGVAEGSVEAFSVDQTSRTFTVDAGEIVNGADYYFQIWSVNEWYESAKLTSSPTVRPLAKPAAIGGFAIDLSDGEVIVRWDAVTDTINTESLVVEWGVDGGSFTGSSVRVVSSTSYTVTGLTNQTAYKFRMKGKNGLSGGDGDYTAVLSGTPRDRVADPVIVSLTAGDSKVILDWTYSGPAGSVDFFDVSAVPVGGGATVVVTVSGTADTYQELGLTNGVEYTVSISGRNTLYRSAVVTAGTVTPLGPPAAVTGLVVDASAASVIISWTAATNTVSTAGYDISYVDTRVGGDGARTLRVVGGAVAGATISGLVDNVTYEFSIRGYNAISVGPWSAPVVTAKPRGRPVAPVVGTLVAGVGKATLTWTAGVGAVAADIDSYEIRAVGSGETDKIYSVVDGLVTGGSTMTQELTGLTNGTTYTVTIWSKNNLFASAVVSAGTVTPLAVPAAVSGVDVSGRDMGAVVNWFVATDGFTTTYRVRWYRSDLSVGSATTAVVSHPGTTYTISGLTNNVAYVVSVRGENAVTEGVYSGGLTVTPRGRPVAPAAAAISASIGKAVLTSITDGAGVVTADIDTYVVTATAGALSTEFTILRGTTLPVDLGGLVNGTTYTMTIRSANNIYASVDVAAGTVTPLAKPADVAFGVVDASNASIIVRWVAAADSADVAVGGYDVEYKTVAAATWTTWGRIVGRTTESTTITELDNGTAYNIRIRAYNAVTVGDWVVFGAARTPRGYAEPPTTVTATAGDGTALVSWTWTGSMANIDNYYVTYTGQVGGPTEVAASARSLPISGLTNGTTYTFGVYSANTIFTSATVTATATPLGSPATPSLSGTATSESVSLSWTIASTTDISGFIVYQGGVAVKTLGAAARSTTVDLLTNRTAYSFTVKAFNTNNTASAASTAVILTPRAIPAAPSSLTGLADISDVVLEWALAGAGEELEDLDRYQIEVYSGSTVSGTAMEVINIDRDAMPTGFTFDTLTQVRIAATDWSGNETLYAGILTYAVTGFTNGSTYTFRMRVRNKNGEYSASDAWSPTATATPLADVPVPVVTAVRASSGAVTMTWTMPTSYGAANIGAATINATVAA